VAPWLVYPRVGLRYGRKALILRRFMAHSLTASEG